MDSESTSQQHEPLMSQGEGWSSWTDAKDERQRPSRVGLPLLCTILVITNVVTATFLWHVSDGLPGRGYTGIGALGEQWIQYFSWTDFSSSDRATAQAAWDGFQTNGFVAVPHEWAAGQRLPKAEDFPDDSSKGVYVVDGFHQLHCVMYLREQVLNLMDGGRVDDHFHHLSHCFDYLRQAIQCRADDTLWYLAPHNNLTAGDGQVRKCRDWKALEAWASKRTACYPTGHCQDLTP